MRHLPNVAALTVALWLGAAATSTAQPAGAGARATPDTAQLRQSLAQALGENFRIVRHELSYGLRERGGTFWLVHATPTRSGDFHLRYRYDYFVRARPDDRHYTHVQHESYVRVGERGCWRRREHRDVCLGDTIILPFVLDDHRAHTFSLTFRGQYAGYGPLGPGALPQGLRPATDSIANPAAAHLRFLGTTRFVMPHRVLGGTTVHSAEFEALAPGRFNLAVNVRHPGTSLEPGSPHGSVPVIVVPRGQPVTVLLANEQVTGVDSIRRFSSHSGNQYLTTHLLLQPGDRISLEYSRVSIRGRDPRPDSAHVAPSIARYPFDPKLGDRFNAWVARYLPRERN
jgi:hypothetical protein